MVKRGIANPLHTGSNPVCNSIQKGNTVEERIYLKMNVNGCTGMTKKPPRLLGDERAIAIDIKVDDSVFEYTFMRSTLEVTEDDVVTPSLEVELKHANDQL